MTPFIVSCFVCTFAGFAIGAITALKYTKDIEEAIDRAFEEMEQDE